MEAKKSKKTFWPYGILLSIIGIAIACVATVIISLDYPVHMDTFYLEKYQDVDLNYNEIQKSQKAFDKKYRVSLTEDMFDVNKDINLGIKIEPKSDIQNSKFDFEVLITRPETAYLDQRPEFSFKDGIFYLKPFQVEQKGRWQVVTKIRDSKNSTGFFKFEFLAK